MPLKHWLALLGPSLALLSCRPSSEETLRANPAAGQALVVAFEVSQVAHATAASLAARPMPGCRPGLVCPTGPATITTTITLRCQEPTGTSEAVERTVWSRDSSGNLGMVFQTSTPAPAGGQTSHELALRRIGDERYGALDGRFVDATAAPLLDERLAADPQGALDSLFALATAGDAETPLCAVVPATLPGTLASAKAELSADRRRLQLKVELPTARLLEIEVDEQIACAAEAITAPQAIEAVAPSGTTAALEALLTAGHTEGWLLATPQHEAPRH